MSTPSTPAKGSAAINLSGYQTGADHPNQLDLRLLGTQGLVPWDGVDSASRKQMFASHMGQALTISMPSERRIQTGMEYEYGKYTFNVKMPENGRVIKIIDRFPQAVGSEDGFLMNSERLVLFESDTGELGMVSLPFYACNHPYFGFQYQQPQSHPTIVPGQTIAKDTVLLDSPNKGPNGEYMYGLELNIAFMTHPAVAEDGIILSRSALNKLKYRTYEKRVINFGKEHYPINLYGDERKYKSFPDIGEYCHPPRNEHPGMLIALRQFNEDLITIDQSINSLQRVEHVFDKCIYADGAGGKVVDIKMYHQHPGRAETNCEAMLEQPLRYARATYHFHKSIVDFYMQEFKRRGKAIRLSPALHRLVVESMAVTSFKLPNLKENLRLSYKAAPLDEFRMEVVVEYEKVPSLGAKATDTMGGKGVCCLIMEDEDMPVDINGVRAEAIFDPNATNNRMNYGRGYEQFLSAACVNLGNIVRNHLNVNANMPKDTLKRAIQSASKEAKQACYTHLQNFYNITVPEQQAKWYAGLPEKDKEEDLYYICKESVSLHFPPSNPVYLPQMVEDIRKHYPVPVGPVKYRGFSGNIVETKVPVAIGSVYCILLEKVGDDWSAVSTSKTQHNGVITHISPDDKDTTPTKEQATRVLGETEFRMTNSYVGGHFSAELHDRSSSPVTRQQIAKTILRAERPTLIEKVTDRTVNPLGFGKPLQLLREVAHCAGWEFAYKPFDQTQQAQPTMEDIATMEEVSRRASDEASPVEASTKDV